VKPLKPWDAQDSEAFWRSWEDDIVRTHQALPLLGDLQLIKARLAKSHNVNPPGTRSNVSLPPEDCDHLVQLIEAIANGENVLTQYWLKRKKKLPKQRVMNALFDLATRTKPTMRQKEIDYWIARIAPGYKLTASALRHYYQDYLLPVRTATRKQKKLSTKIQAEN